MALLGNSGKSAIQQVLNDLLQTDENGNLILVLNETEDPSTPPVGTIKLYAKDNGAGGTSLYIKFPNGVVSVIIGD